MALGKRCTCAPSNWFVVHRKCSYSAFNGYRYAPSLSSAVRCRKCGAAWRTKAWYVETLPDRPPY